MEKKNINIKSNFLKIENPIIDTNSIIESIVKEDINKFKDLDNKDLGNNIIKSLVEHFLEIEKSNEVKIVIVEE